MAQLWLDVPIGKSKNEFIRNLRNLLPGIDVIIDCYGRSLIVYLSYRDDRPLSEQLKVLSRPLNTRNTICFDLPFPSCAFSMKQIDWAIVQSLLKAPRKPFNEIAEELGVSTRTIKRRTERMVSGRALFAVPEMNLEVVEGIIGVGLLVSYKDQSAKSGVDSQVLNRYAESVVVAELSNGQYGFFVFAIRNVSRAEEILDWVRQLEGVRMARLNVFQRRVEVHDLHDNLVKVRAGMSSRF